MKSEYSVIQLYLKQEFIPKMYSNMPLLITPFQVQLILGNNFYLTFFLKHVPTLLNTVMRRNVASKCCRKIMEQ